ncbi:MAG: SH3 domain-containing protein [Thermoactinomyces sp.]
MKHWKWVFTSILAIVLVFGTYFGTVKASTNYQIEINKSTNKLYLYKEGLLQKIYSVAVSPDDELTPEGTFVIAVKINKPGWKDIPGGSPQNPLGDKWLGFSVNGDNGRTYGIHGTNEPESIGRPISSGCIRMKNNDIHYLFKIIPEGTPIWIHSGKSTGKWNGDPSFTVQPLRGQLRVTVNLANIRTGPSLGAFIIQQAETGTILEMTGFIKEWYQIETPDGKTGFIHESTVVYNSGVVTPNRFAQAAGYLKLTGPLTNIRSNPSLAAPIVQRAKKGTELILTGENRSWYRVQLSSGFIAYVHKSAAEKDKYRKPDSKLVTTNVFLAKIRNAPSRHAAVIKRAARDTQLEKIGTNGEWLIIKLKDGRTGFIHKDAVHLAINEGEAP